VFTNDNVERMVNKKVKNNIVGAIIVLIIIGSLMFFLKPKVQTAGGFNDVFIGVPQYGSIQCGKIVNGVDVTFTVPDVNKHLFTCGIAQSSSETGIVGDLFDGCDFYIKFNDAKVFATELYITNSNNPDKPVGGVYGSGMNYLGNFPQGSKLVVNPSNLFYDSGDIEVGIKAQRYGLVSSAGGYLRNTESCNLNSLTSSSPNGLVDLHSGVSSDSSIPIKFSKGQIFNYVLYTIPAYGSSVNDIIELDGKRVYVSYNQGLQSFGYFPLKITGDGFSYVDVSPNLFVIDKNRSGSC